MAATPKQRFIEATQYYSNGEIEKYLAYLSDDIEQWGADGMPEVGKEAIEKSFREIFDEGAHSKIVINDVTEVMTGDDSAYVKAYLQLEGEEGSDYKDLTIWRKINGQWLMVVDCYSTIKPHGE